MESSLFLTCLCISIYAYHVSASLTKEDIRQKIDWVIENAEPDVIPVNGAPLNVTLSLELSSIREVDTSMGEIEILAMRSIKWRNPNLSWQGRGAGSQVHSVSVDIKHLWSPDIVPFNSVHAPELLSSPIALVIEDGTNLYVPNERIRFRCNLESFETPEGSNCTVRYGSWTYHGGMLDLKVDHNAFPSWDYDAHPGFDLLGTYAEVETHLYACCPEPYKDVKFTLNIRKKTGSVFGWKK